ncbi:MAG: M48 family metallopeptidase [Solirubrobacteraceae bacterium]
MTSLRSRIALAIALTVAFYTLAVAIALGLIVLPIVVWAAEGRGNIWVAIALIGAGIAILRAIVPERARFAAPGPELGRDAQPRLRALLDEVAHTVGDRPPEKVYLDLDVNASVLEHRGERIMLLGLPLVSVLAEDELRAVVAHEHGHYVAGDTRFSSWIWRTRVAVLKAVHELVGSESWFRRSVLSWPFRGYALLFLRLTNAVSRRQEFAADALSARVTSADAAGRALRRINAVAPLWDMFWNEDVVPMLQSRRRPPLSAGLVRMLTGRAISGVLETPVPGDMAAGEPDPYASHPTLGQRLEALGVPVDPSVPSKPEKTAITLLDDVAELERQLLETQFGQEVRGLEVADWQDAAEVHHSVLQQDVERFGAVLGSRTLGEAGEAAAALADLREPLRAAAGADADVPAEDLDGLALRVLGAAVACAAVRAGAELSALPGEPLLLRTAAGELDVWGRLTPIATGAQPPAEWTAQPVVAALRAEPLVQTAT